MSLILYYRDCFTADKRVVDLSQSTLTSQMVNKTYLSEDKMFAGMACGAIPTKAEWESVRNYIDIYRLQSNKNDKIDRKLLAETSAKINILFENNYFDYNLIIVVRDLMLIYKVYEEIGVLSHYDPTINYVEGTGKYAAHVLINSGKEINQTDFFKIVSYSEPMVSPEYDFIALKDVIDTPWYRKAKET